MDAILAMCPSVFAADVVVIRGIRQRADPHAIQHDPNDSFEHVRDSIRFQVGEYMTGYLTDKIRWRPN